MRLIQHDTKTALVTSTQKKSHFRSGESTLWWKIMKNTHWLIVHTKSSDIYSESKKVSFEYVLTIICALVWIYRSIKQLIKSMAGVNKHSENSLFAHTYTCHQWDNSIQQTIRVNVYSHCMQPEVISMECTNMTLISTQVSGEQSSNTESEIIPIHTHTHTVPPQYLAGGQKSTLQGYRVTLQIS